MLQWQHCNLSVTVCNVKQEYPDDGKLAVLWLILAHLLAFGTFYSKAVFKCKN